MMFDNQINIRQQPPMPAPPPVEKPQPVQAQQAQFVPPPEVSEKISEFRQQQHGLQLEMRDALLAQQQGHMTPEQFEAVKLQVQVKQSNLVAQMNHFQVQYQPILQQMANAQRRTVEQQQADQHHQRCNHDHGGQGHNHGEHSHGGHSHENGHGGHDHGGHQHQGNWNPFANVPTNMRVFILNSLINGDYCFGMFMQLPMMGQGYQLMQGLRRQLTMPMYQLNNLINMRLDGVPVPLLREFFGGLGIFYLVFHYFVYRWIISDRVATLANKDGFIDILQYSLLSIVLSALGTILVDAGDLSTKANKTRFEELSKQKPEMQYLGRKQVCLLCQIPKIVRSQHCMYTKRCIARYENHSLMLNTPIGAYNYPFYLWFVGSLSSYFLIILWGYTLQTRETFSKSIFDLFALLINIHQLHYFLTSTLVTVLKISYNLTQAELHNWRRQAYLWKNERGEFQNPFDKGYILNWYAFYLPLLNRVLRRTQTGETIDWGQARIFSVMDIKNHPMATRMAEEMQRQGAKMQMKTQKYQQHQQAPDEKQGLLAGENA